MILVDVYVPSIDKSYDFQFDENAYVNTITEEIGELIGQKEHSRVVGNIEQLILCSRTTGIVLPRNLTLNQCKIKTGDSLILV